MKDVYRARSKVVHGRTGRRPRIDIGTSRDLSATQAALVLLRRALQVVIPRSKLWDPANIDDVLVLGSFGDMPDHTRTAEEEEQP